MLSGRQKKAPDNGRIGPFSFTLPTIDIPSVDVPELGTIGGGSLGGQTFRPPQMPTIPALGQGGIVRQPTLAMIGEAGPEAVVPLRDGGGVGLSEDSISRLATAIGQQQRSDVHVVNQWPEPIEDAVIRAMRRIELVRG